MTGVNDLASACDAAVGAAHTSARLMDDEEDAALARALSSQRSERLSVAHKRAANSTARKYAEEEDRSDDEDYNPSGDEEAGGEDDEGEEEEDEFSEAEVLEDAIEEGDDALEEGEIAPPPAARRKTGKAPADSTLPKGSRKRQVFGK